MAVPAADGSNISEMFIVWPGVSVAGRLTGESEKPAPVTFAEFTVTAYVPVDVKVTVCVAALLTRTAPNEMLLALRLRIGTAAFSCSESVRQTAAVVAVSVTAFAVLTEAMFAIKVALFAIAGTRIELGTVAVLLLLERATFRPPAGAEPERVTVQESASDPVTEMLLQNKALTVGNASTPDPAKFTVAVGALLLIVTMPV